MIEVIVGQKPKARNKSRPQNRPRTIANNKADPSTTTAYCLSSGIVADLLYHG